MKMDNLVPVLAAIISATALLWGYAYQKGKEADAEILKKQQEIYSNLITNITTRNSVMGHILDSPAYTAASQKEEEARRRADSAAATASHDEMDAMFFKDPAFIENRNQRTEIVALLCLYGTDEAIKAYTDFSAKAIGPHPQIDDVGELIVALRRSLTNKHAPDRTLITAREANLGIWWENKFLPTPMAAK